MVALSVRLRGLLATILCLPGLTLGATLTPTSLSFGGQSMNTSSPAQTVTFTNNQGTPITISSITVSSAEFPITHNCPGSLGASASCTITVTFKPAVGGSSVNDTTTATGTLSVASSSAGSPNAGALSGTGERSLVTHYFRSILRRAPDSGGKTFWQNETTRAVSLGLNVNEVWYAMAANFFAGSEYAAFNRSNNEFITDLYTTFFNRAPDSGGSSFWNTNLSGGMPREVALAEFMFSTEFRTFTQAIFGNTAVRAESDMVTDFYRGLLARLPDDSGFNFWVGKFRTAQCSGDPQTAITNEVEAISSAYALSAEYSARARSNAQYVGDLYNAFLRRGGDLGGVNYWVGQLNSAAQTREQVRIAFKNSTEFQARVNAVIAQGCLGTGKTYYLATTGNDSNSGLSQAAAWKTFAKAWQVLAPSDMLFVANGSYSSFAPPTNKAGTATQPITIQAINPGGVSISRTLLNGNAYLTFIGLKFTGDPPAVELISSGSSASTSSHHIVFQQVAITCTTNLSNNAGCLQLNYGAHHVTVEDSWIWGGGRYTILCYGGNTPKGCDNNTFRRLVLRHGPTISPSGAPHASTSFYYASNNLVENVLAIDGLQNSDTSNAVFYIPSHSPPPGSDLNKYYGVIALNNLGSGFYIDCDGICRGAEVHDSVFWDNKRNGMVVTGKNDPCDAVLNRNTVGKNNGHGYQNYNCVNATLTNNAMFQNTGYGAQVDQYAGTTPTNHHNGYYQNTSGARQNLPAGTGDTTLNPGMLYITRIESGSPYKNAGVSGSIGANVINRYENGVLTATPLWPWPNEDRIRTDMCAGVTTGWCATGKTLTRYIWEYLGNTIPAGIYPP